MAARIDGDARQGGEGAIIAWEDLSPQIELAVRRYAEAEGMSADEAANHLLRTGMEAFRALPPERQREEVEKWKSRQSAESSFVALRDGGEVLAREVRCALERAFGAIVTGEGKPMVVIGELTINVRVDHNVNAANATNVNASIGNDNTQTSHSPVTANVIANATDNAMFAMQTSNANWATLKKEVPHV